MLRHLSLSTLAALSLLTVACENDEERDPGNTGPEGMFPVPDPVDPVPQDPGVYLEGIEGEFQAASDEFGVPIEILKAVGYVESQWQMVAGEVEFDGLDPAFGAMALRGANLSRAAALLDVDEDSIKTLRPVNIRAAAALLSEKADAQDIDRGDLGAWAQPIADLSGIKDGSAAAINYVHQNVFALISNGLVVTDLAGNVISEIEPTPDVIPDYPTDVPVLNSTPDYAGAKFRPTPNKGSRPAGDAGKVRIVIIHTCEGAYSGCWGWLANSQSGVSAHYVVKEDGAEVTQLVKESERAYHIAAKYKPELNGGQFEEVSGAGSNNFTVGIEHAGFGSQASWNPNLIDQSAALVCDITRRHGLPRDKYHIVGHGQLQPYNRSDPGKQWPWATYFEKINKICNDAPAEDPADPPPPPPDKPPESDPDPPADPTTADPTTADPTTADPTTADPTTADPTTSDPPPSDNPAELIIDSNDANNDPSGDFADPSSAWVATSSTPGYYGNNYYYASITNVDDGAVFWFYLDGPGSYDVSVWYTAGTNRASDTPIVAFDAAGTELGFEFVDQTSGGSQWTPAGSYAFTAGWNAVMVSRWATTGDVVVADAVRLTAN